MNMAGRNNRAWLLVLPAMLVMALNAFIPFITVINYSVQDIFPGLSTIWVGLENYQTVLGDDLFRGAFARQLRFSMLILALEIPLGIAIALAMPKRSWVATVTLVALGLPLLIPFNVVGIIWRVFTRSDLGAVPLIFDFQGSLTAEMIDHNFLSRRNLFYKPLRWLERRIDHAADVILTSSVHAARLLIEQFGIPSHKIDPTPDCVNADTFCADNFSPAEKRDLKAALGVPLDKKLIVYLGVLAPYQGIDMLLETLNILGQTRDDYHLLLMGYPAVARFQEHARMVGVSDLVTFTGKIPYQEAPRYLALGDIATAPKISATEGSGKILNYMAMGLPTVAFTMPVSQEFLGDGGIYAHEVSSQALALAINRALDLTPDERTRLGHYLRQRVINHFSWGRVIEQIEAVYDALLTGKPLPTANIISSPSYRLPKKLL